MIRTIVTFLGASAVYGFSIGYCHSLTFALRNIVKLPLLLSGTAAVCAVAYFVCVRFQTNALNFAVLQDVVWETYRNIAVLLASMASVNLFLAATMKQPTSPTELNDYPLFLGLNVALISVCGCMALAREGVRLLHEHGLRGTTAFTILAVWLTLALPVGGQWAWYLRPFFGVSVIPAESFCLGSLPDFRGDTNFFEAVYHLIKPPVTPY
jgi:hypothetical protein